MLVTLVIATFLTSQLLVNARYLPTRSQDDRLDKLRELLKDLLEGDAERRPMGMASPGMDYGELMGSAGRPTIYKRSANLAAATRGAGVMGHNHNSDGFLHRVNLIPDFRKSTMGN